MDFAMIVFRAKARLLNHLSIQRFNIPRIVPGCFFTIKGERGRQLRGDLKILGGCR